MLGNTGNTILGSMLYYLGLFAAALYLNPVEATLHPVVEIVIVTVGILFLAPLFYGRIAFLLMLAAGILLGAGFVERPLYSLIGVVPSLIALLAGTQLGRNALEDLEGKKNFFTDSKVYIAKGALAIAIAIAIGVTLGGISLAEIIGFAEGSVEPELFSTDKEFI